jgi:hypothetical protein
MANFVVDMIFVFWALGLMGLGFAGLFASDKKVLENKDLAAALMIVSGTILLVSYVMVNSRAAG